MLDFLRSFCISLMSTSRNSTLFSSSSTFVLVFSVLSFRFCTSFSKKAKDSSRDAIDLCKLSRRASMLSSFCNLFNIMSSFFSTSSAIDSAVSTSSSPSLVLVERLASLLFFFLGRKGVRRRRFGSIFPFWRHRIAKNWNTPKGGAPKYTSLHLDRSQHSQKLECLSGAENITSQPDHKSR